MDFTFTPHEESHAKHVLNRLYRHKRFFLPKGVSVDNPLPHLPNKVFGGLYDLHQKQEDFYDRLALSAELAIREEEAKLGITHHKLTDGQRLAQCNRFYGGLEIFAVAPLAPLVEIYGNDFKGLADELFRKWHHDTDIVRMRDIERFDEYVDMLRADVSVFFQEQYEKRVLVVLGTRFNCGHKNLLSERIDGLVRYPYLSSYVMYKLASNEVKLSPHMTTVFGELGNHISMDFFPGHARITPVSNSNYEERIAFATIL